MTRTWAGEVRNVSLLVASAVNSEGFREILGICEGAKEDKSGWSAFLRRLVDRGLKGVQLIISDACRGLMESAAEYLPEARWQRCMVHFYRNVFSHVPATKVREVSHMLKAIHAQESRDAANRKARGIIDDLRAARMNTAADLVERSVHETLTYYAFPDIHWQKIRTTDVIDKSFVSSVLFRRFLILYWKDAQRNGIWFRSATAHLRRHCRIEPPRLRSLGGRTFQAATECSYHFSACSATRASWLRSSLML